MRHRYARAAAFALPLALAACMDESYGLNSQHQPIVADGKASVPDCPNWSSKERDSAARTDSNFGCAINSNLAAMIADPNDLLRGKVGKGPDADTIVRGTKAWRETGPSGKNGIEKVSARGGS